MGAGTGAMMDTDSLPSGQSPVTPWTHLVAGEKPAGSVRDPESAQALLGVSGGDGQDKG